MKERIDGSRARSLNSCYYGQITRDLWLTDRRSHQTGSGGLFCSQSGWEDPGSLLPCSPTVNKSSIIGGSCWSRTPSRLLHTSNPSTNPRSTHSPTSSLRACHIPSTVDPKQQSQQSLEARTEPNPRASACEVGMRSIEKENLCPVFAFPSRR
jgi:hypothetical protein